MSVYVDNITEYPTAVISKAAQKHGRKWSHMAADSLEELHEMARLLKLKKSYFQFRVGGVPHYDVTPSKRALALAMGAILVEGKERAIKFKELREKFKGGVGDRILS